MDKPTEKPSEFDHSQSPLESEKRLENGAPVAVLNIADPDEGLSEEERRHIDRKLLWKLDLKLIPWLTLLYLIAFLDRTNIGNAKIDGLQEDLKMTNNQYNNTLTIFFISYSVFEPVTQVLLKKFKPSIFLPAIMFLWGVSMTCMGLVHNYSGLLATRWFLGLAEAGLFPGVNYYLSCWYRRSEFGIRAAIFFSAAALAGSFGGLLAAAIENMDGVADKAGWSWIFILEGLFTVIISFLSFFMVHDFPDDARFLSDDDRRRVIRRLKLDQQSSAEHEEFKMEYFWASLKDWKTWTGMLIYMGCDGALYAFSLFLPTIVAQMGYKSIHAQLLSVPPYAVAAVVTIFIGFVADRTGWRGYCNMVMALFGIAGFAMLLGSGSPHIQYAGVFLGAMGIYPCVPNTISWAANNIEGVYKRGISLGFIIGWGNLNGIVSSNIYRAKDKPRYKPGHAVVLAYEALFLLGGSILQHILLRRENAKRRNGKRDHWAEGKSEAEIEKLGDKRPDFIYTL
ncbi:retrograde regulation protein 2 [Exophiala viscosa]|uniref:Retrograde regulation protein 2 n=1 Tax=Exophiala viscosa TaxID=2486360 RepID=A0AAN6IE45_9EURO|nr:retrograde regulation protein 2 [Exophiala viscosa]KAI1621318.1 retrograde regulation protein 2 [Exophiala viscosa]